MYSNTTRNKAGKWPINTTKSEIRRLLPIATNFVNEKNTIWVRLNDHDYPRIALFLPQIYRKKAICQAHGSLLSGHDALDKTYIRLTSSFFWPTVKTDIQKHIDSCLQCQQRKKSTAKPIQAAGAPTSTEGAKVVLTISGPPKNLGAIPKNKSSAAGRQKTPKVGQGPNREAKGPGGSKIP